MLDIFSGQFAEGSDVSFHNAVVIRPTYEI